MIEQATNTRCDLDPRPLGIRPDVPLTDAQLTALQRLEDYDLGPVRARLLKQDMLPADRVDDAILEFRRSLGLLILGYPGVPVVSTAVDEVWHACLLLSPLYADLCEQTVGHFVHHEPVDDYEPSAKIAGGASGHLDDTLRAFQQAYTRVYGAAIPRIEPGQQEPAAGAAKEGLLQEVQLDHVTGGGGLSGGVVSCFMR